MSASRLGTVVIVALVLTGLWLRWHGTDWGAPYGYHFDEPFIMKPALRMAANGDPNPRFFRYPSAVIYLETGISLAHHRLTGMDLLVPEGPAYGPSDLGKWTWPALLSGRRAVALLGTGTLVATAAAAWVLAGPCAGMIAAALLAFAPLHVEHSHYLTTDVPATAFLALSFAVALGVPASNRRAAMAGAALGAAIASKYTAAAGLPGLLVVLMLYGAQPRQLALTCAAAVVLFFLLCPYALIDWRLFLADINIVREHYASGHFGAEGSSNWGWYLQRLFDDGLGGAEMGLLGFGLLASFWNALRTAKIDGKSTGHVSAARAGAVISLTALLWFVWLGTVTVRFERNLIPALVLAVIGAAGGLTSSLAAMFSRRRFASIILTLVLVGTIASVARMALATTRRLSGSDTRELAGKWIQTHVPTGASIVREEYAPRPDPQRYRVDYLWSAAFRDPEWYIRNRVDYVILSSAVYGRFFHDSTQRYPQIVERYHEMLGWQRALQMVPGPSEMGPVITVLRPPQDRGDR